MLKKHIASTLAVIAAAGMFFAGCESAEDVRESLAGTANTPKQADPVINDPDDPSFNTGNGISGLEPITKTVSIGSTANTDVSFSGKTPDSNLSPNTITVTHTIGTDPIEWKDDGSGNLTCSHMRATTGTINYSTGSFTINYSASFGAPGSVSVTYTYYP